MGDIGRRRARYEVLAVRATVPNPEPMPVPHPEPMPEPVPHPEPMPDPTPHVAAAPRRG